MDLPQVLLCKPSHNDRFDRRVVSLAAFRFRYGHVNVPEVSPLSSSSVTHLKLESFAV